MTELIEMNDFASEPEALRISITKAVERVLDSGWFVLGPEVESFEAAWATQCGTSYAVGVANGMDAIELMLRGQDIGPGDEVITTTMTAFATVLGIRRAGATPVLADIDPTTGLMSLESATRCLSKDTRAVLTVHLDGQIREMAEWISFCRQNDITLLEDGAQAHGAHDLGQVAGSFGKAAAFSFYPTKNLGAVGDAGAVVTSDYDLAERLKVLRNYGQSERYHHVEEGLNSRLDELQAAILLERLKFFPTFTARRRSIAMRYMAEINNEWVTLPEPPKQSEAHVYHLFVLRTDKRDQLQTHLRAAGINVNIHYPVPVHMQPPCQDLRRDPAGLRASEKYANQCISIPCHPQMNEEDLSRVIETVNSFRG